MPGARVRARSSSFEGAAEGDTFKFRQTKGAMLGEMMVAEDRMTGFIIAA